MENHNSTIFVCSCNKQYKAEDDKQIQDHIFNCQTFKDSAHFYTELSRAFPLEKRGAIELLRYKYDFLYCQKLIEDELLLRGMIPLKLLQIEKKKSSTSSREEPQFDHKAFSKLEVKCVLCEKHFDSIFDQDKLYYFPSCINQHPHCKECLVKNIMKDFIPNNGVLQCKICKNQFQERDFLNILGPDKLADLNQLLIEKQFNIVTCIKCKEKFEFQCGHLGDNVVDANGYPLSEELELHYVENRFTCLNQKCKQEQCKNCRAFPYHLGYTCETFQQFQIAKKCRYCNEQMTEPNKNNPAALQDICSNQECKNKQVMACTKILECGHPCYGLKDEIHCIPCLQPECVAKHQESSQNSDDYCNICFVESLGNAPCVKTNCGHLYHLHCLQKRLELRWSSIRITFNYCLCPLCKVWMNFPVEQPLEKFMFEQQILFEDIKKKSQERLKYECRFKDEKLNDPKSAYYNKPLEYALAIYAYYQCFKCKKPFFGGLKDCERAMEEDKIEFNPKELICPNCCEIPIENCSRHGADYIGFKCKFCCSMAQWFCWGTTHFCEPCHQKECNGERISQQPKEKLPVCPGKDKCPLQIEHKPNGEECPLGCSLCRNLKENIKDF